MTSAQLVDSSSTSLLKPTRSYFSINVTRRKWQAMHLTFGWFPNFMGSHPTTQCQNGWNRWSWCAKCVVLTTLNVFYHSGWEAGLSILMVNPWPKGGFTAGKTSPPCGFCAGPFRFIWHICLVSFAPRGILFSHWPHSSIYFCVLCQLYLL